MPHGMAQTLGHQRYSCSCGLTQHSSRLSGKCKQCHGSLKPIKSSASNGFSPTQSTEAIASVGGERASGSQHSGGSHRRDTTPSSRYATDRRRSRSADRGEGRSNIREPPPYYTLTDGVRRRNVGLHRAGSEEPTYRTQTRRTRATPPPSYMDTESSNPPSYEEALASSMSRLSTNSGLSALIETTPTLRERSSISSGLFDTNPQARPESQQVSNRETTRATRRQAQRQAEREAQRQREHEIEEMGRQRLRELQVAQYCGCDKCQSLFYNYYYDEDVSGAPPIPMETQVIMQQFFGDGLTFCSLM